MLNLTNDKKILSEYSEVRITMLSKTYLWIEDKKEKSSYIFWQTMMYQLCPGVIVESKRNNSELVKAVKGLKDEDNKYIIVFDNSFDNLQVYQELKALKRSVDTKKNVYLMDIICFEYVLLSFDKLIDWIYAPDDEFRIKRKTAMKARSQLVDMLCSGRWDYKVVREIIEYDNKIVNHNIEQLSAKLLFDLTRNTGFEVSKSRIGYCWIKSCCEWEERQSDDICGLDCNRLLVSDKMKCIWKGTSLFKEFANVGLEVAL